ncbi:MAG: tRNA (adenosine(37)-N6)-threonylcarbamoyltransferase complex ATPase subunit type 1 TsaE [Spirochaetales bacterium]|nr:MAG: tRNA (adenosine(37)-N6)-threonylcarbamoyltransferase complex ATPase subunit type 1 TsaE [Spirochaetales bacterium]
MNTVVSSNSPEETRQAGLRLAASLKPGDVVALSGVLGAGKTVFVQGMAEALEIKEPVTSPTFTLIGEYQGKLPLYHMDLYRLGSPGEFVWLGVEEMLNGKGITVIEWAERAGEELPERSISVEIALTKEGHRSISIKHAAGETE